MDLPKPKENGEAPKEAYYNAAHELKVIIYNQNDFKWAEEHAAKMHEGCQLFLQPEWSKREEMMPHIVDYVMTHSEVEGELTDPQIHAHSISAWVRVLSDSRSG